MKVRADASQATGQRILEAAHQRFGELPYDQVSLQAVAEQAGVTVQTVLRRFASKERLFAAVAAWMSVQVRGERGPAPVGDVAGVVSALVDHYERRGDHRLNLLAQEQRTPAIRDVTDAGRRYHHAWVERSFAPQLARLSKPERRLRLAQLDAVTDVYVWKVLRRDLGLGRDETERALRDLATRVLARLNESPGTAGITGERLARATRVRADGRGRAVPSPLAPTLRMAGTRSVEAPQARAGRRRGR